MAWVFFLNLPIALAAILVTYLVVAPDTPAKGGEKIDYRGMGALTLPCLRCC